jgi:DNA-binding PadR family transcriptional regulator
MAVRDALLALLTVGPAYGFQLHGGLTTRTGGRRSINVGQTYATLERLRKQGLVEPAGTTDDGLPLYGLTPGGAAAARSWLRGTDAAGADPWDETIDRVLIARSLPGVDADAVLAGERERWARRLEEASGSTDDSTVDSTDARAGAPSDEASASDGERQLVGLVTAAERSRAEAMLGWLDAVASEDRIPFAPRAERPKRGRRPGSASVVADAVEAAGLAGETDAAQPESAAQPADA